MEQMIEYSSEIKWVVKVDVIHTDLSYLCHLELPTAKSPRDQQQQSSWLLPLVHLSLTCA